MSPCVVDVEIDSAYGHFTGELMFSTVMDSRVVRAVSGLLGAGVAAPCDAFFGCYSSGGVGVDSEHGGDHGARCGVQEFPQGGGSGELNRHSEFGEAVVER